MRITLAILSVFGYFGAQVCAQSVDAPSNSTSSNSTTFVDLDWTTEHIGTHRGYPTDTVSAQDEMDEEYVLEQYQLIKRHGTRYPGDDDMEAYAELVSKLANSTNEELAGWAKYYDNEFVVARDGLLTTGGQLEHYTHGQRVAMSYPDIVNSVVDDDVVHFSAYSSWSDRVSQSGNSFLLGAFESAGNLSETGVLAIPLFTYPKDHDTMIAFHKACPRWVTEVDDGDYADQFVAPYDANIVQPIAERLTKSLGFNITIDDVKNIYGACGFEVTMHDTADTFCRLLTEDDILKLEYEDDLEHWYKLSYGYDELNAGMACNLGKAIIENIDLAANGTKGFPTLDLKFGHDETLLPLRTFFGLQKDNFTLVWNSTQSDIDSRVFRLSDFSYFANNLAFQVFSSTNTTNQQKYVRVLDNEAPIVFPGCDDEYCPYEQFKEAVTPLLSCDYDKTCATNTTTSS